MPTPPTAWPPIIRDAALPRAIVWRDRICTTAMWLLLLWLCRSAVHALWETSRALFQNGHLYFAGWSGSLSGLRPYFEVIALLAAWEIVWMMITLWRRRRYLRLPQPPPLTLHEEAKKINGAPAELSAWRKLKICVAYLDSKGDVSVLPKKARDT